MFSVATVGQQLIIEEYLFSVDLSEVPTCIINRIT